jgi:Ca2+-transporting ATPase
MNYNNQSIADLEKKFRTSSLQGLSSNKIQDLLKIYGKNKVGKKKILSISNIILQQFMNPLVYVLLVSSVVLFFTGTFADTCIVLLIVFLNCSIGAIQEYRLARIINHLEGLQKRDYILLRDGDKVVIEEENIVPGDIVILQDGQKVPADGRIVMGYDLVVDESMLTGESKPVKKTVEIKNEAVSDRLDMQHTMLFSGTALVSGYAQMLVVATGKATESGKIQAYIPDIVTDLPLQKDLERLIRFVLVTIVVICVTLFILGILDGKPFGELFAALLALFMCAVPQGLPVIMTLILAVGSYRLAKHHILAKRLQAVEGLGRADVLVVDKTGTLTSNELMVTSLLAGNAVYTFTGSGYNPAGEAFFQEKSISSSHEDAVYQHMIQGAYLLDRSKVMFNEEAQRFVVKGNPNEAALGVCAQKSGIQLSMIQERFYLVYEIPFHPDTQFHACFYKDTYSNEGIIYATGSFEGFYKQGITQEDFSKDLLNNSLHQGTRIMAFSYAKCELSSFDIAPQENDEKKEYFLTMFKKESALIGFFEVEDALRKDIHVTVNTIQNAGIRMIMATGDHVVTAEHIALAAGIFTSKTDGNHSLDLTSASDGDIKKSLKNCSVYGRCLPTDKLRIITLLQQDGYRVAMVGDGVNDVPSLAMSDLGVAMGITGSDSAKEAADLILLQDSFSSIPYGIAEGRHIFYTFKRVIFYFLASNFTEVLVMTVAFIGFPLPLLASHVLWLNLVTDGFLDASLSLEQPEKNLLELSFKKNVYHLISFLTIVHIVALAAISALMTGLVFITYLDWYGLEHARTMCMATLTGCQMINAINSRSLHKSIFDLPLWGNAWLYLALAGIISVLVSIIYVPTLQNIFKTVPLYATDWVMILIVAAALFAVEELRKRILFFLELIPKLK